jgi:hypothetical protein
MDTTMVVGLVLILVVGFFAFQWWSGANRKPAAATAKKTPAPTTIGASTVSDASPAPMNQKPVEEKYPEVAGQTEKELRAKEPAQRPVAATNPQAVTYAGEGPAQIPNNLRRPEQAFHQPPQESGPALKVSEVASGRANPASSPQGGLQQPFSPDFAQNGGAMIGNSVFAYDGMEPNDLSSF